MTDIADLLDLAGRFRRGDADAARMLFEQYAKRLVALAERHLSDRFVPNACQVVDEMLAHAGRGLNRPTGLGGPATA